jgi:predicted transcriptional regulator
MKTLTRAEEQVMQVLWGLQKGFLKDILENSPEPKPHSNTVATLLKILVDKGFVDYEVQGRNNLYRARISKADYGKKSLHQLVKSYFEGSPARMVSQFLSDNKLSTEDLEALQKGIEAARQKGNKG